MDSAARAHLDEWTDDLLRRIGRAVAADARRFAPVDTGELVGSIHVEDPRGNKIRIVASADHAAYVERGTENMAAQPYLAPALYRQRVI